MSSSENYSEEEEYDDSEDDDNSGSEEDEEEEEEEVEEEISQKENAIEGIMNEIDELNFRLTTALPKFGSAIATQPVTERVTIQQSNLDTNDKNKAEKKSLKGVYSAARLLSNTVGNFTRPSKPSQRNPILNTTSVRELNFPETNDIELKVPPALKFQSQKQPTQIKSKAKLPETQVGGYESKVASTRAPEENYYRSIYSQRVPQASAASLYKRPQENRFLQSTNHIIIEDHGQNGNLKSAQNNPRLTRTPDPDKIVTAMRILSKKGI